MDKQALNYYEGEFIKRFNSNSELQQLRIQKLLKNLIFKGDEKVLDIGCGNGLLYDNIKDKISTYHGIDLSNNILKQFKKKIDNQFNHNVFLYNRDIKKFCSNYKDYFDKIFIIDFTEHVYNNELIEILKSSKYSLKERGELIIHTPNSDFFIEKLKKYTPLKQNRGHIAVRNLSEYRLLFERVGLNIKSYKYLSHYNFKLKYFYLLSWLPIIGKYFRARLFIICEK